MLSKRRGDACSQQRSDTGILEDREEVRGLSDRRSDRDITMTRYRQGKVPSAVLLASRTYSSLSLLL